MKNEKYYLKKCRLLICALLIICLSFMAVVYLSVESNTVMMLCYIVIAFVGFFATRIIIRKVILSVLMDDLDAPLFRKIVKKGKFAGVQLWSEYYCGNFGNVVELCRKKLADSKAAKKGRYMYLQRLASVYYVTGDDENLRAICQEVEACLATEKPSIKRKQAAYINLFQVYNAYLAGDWETCEKLEERQAKSNLDRMAGVNSQARIALAKGDFDRAKELFEEARQAPNLCYAACADEGLRAIEEGTPYGEGLEPLATTEDFYVMYPAKVIEFFHRVWIVCCILAVILLWVSAGLELYAKKEAERQEELQIQREEERRRKREEYEEKYRVLIENDYDGVKILDCFTLKCGDETADSMIICEADDGLLIVSTYVYKGEEEPQYESQVYLSKYLFPMGEEIPWDLDFDCVVSDYSIRVVFYNQEQGIPENALAVRFVEACDTPLYVAFFLIE